MPRYKVTKARRTNKAIETAFVLEAIYGNSGVLKFPKVFQLVNGSEFKSDEIDLLENRDQLKI